MVHFATEEELKALRIKVQEILEYLTDHDSMVHPMGGSIRPPSRLDNDGPKEPIMVSVPVNYDLHDKMSGILIDKNIRPTKGEMSFIFQRIMGDGVRAWIARHPEPRGLV